MSRKVLTALTVAFTLLSACQSGQQTPAPQATVAPTNQPANLAPTTAPPTPAPPTAAPTNTELPPTTTPLPPTNTPVSPTNTPVPTATTAPTDTPAPTATSIPRATIKTATLNVRSGPGGNYPVVGSAKQGNALVVRGQIDDCAFLVVTTAEGEAGWIAGGPDFVTLNTGCAAIPQAEAPPVPTAAPVPTSAPVPTAAPVAPQAAGPASGEIAVTVQKYDYAQWGRPAGMVTPGEGCRSFDDGHPVKKLTASLRIENRSTTDMEDWFFFAIKGDGQPALVCYMIYGSGFPVVLAGKGLDITFVAYMEKNEGILYGFVADSNVGRSAKIAFP